MDSSRRAVESYWRSNMIDEATSNEDKVTPVYKLDEICVLLRASHVSIVKEVSGFILKRLEHKSPIVIQKTLRLIKYSVGKSGVEFRREMQRHSAAVRQLFHYKGQPDPLKGDALNKAVRDTAREAISAIFSEENKPQTATEDLSKRIQGFGSTNYEMPSEDRKSFLSEVVGMGSASFKQGLSSFSQSNSVRKNDNGSYRSRNLGASLTTDNDKSDRYEPVKLNGETNGSRGGSNSPASGPWGQDNMASNSETRNGHASGSSIGGKTREERLLETIVTSGGVRLQPTRDAIQDFLVEAAKLDALALSHGLESKLQSPVWQVRMKAVCVLESILRRKEDDHFAIVASYFIENKDVVVRCSESPQSSLREKSLKVLSLFGGQPTGGVLGNSEKSAKAETVSVHMPDLIDTGDSNDFFETKDTVNPTEQKTEDPTAAMPRPSIDDLLGDSFNSGLNTREQKRDDDPFADISFHTSESNEHAEDLFSGMTLDNKPDTDEIHLPSSKNRLETLDLFGSDSEPLQQQNSTTSIDDLMAGMNISDSASKVKQPVATPATNSESIFSDSSSPGNRDSNGALPSVLSSQVTGMNGNTVFPSSTLPFSVPPGYMLNPAYNMQPMNFAALGGYLSQQQYLAMMANFQHLSNFNAQNAGFNQSTGSTGDANALPDIFQSNYPNQAPTSTMNSSKKEDTRAFDFISDHLAAARDPKRVT